MNGRLAAAAVVFALVAAACATTPAQLQIVAPPASGATASTGRAFDDYPATLAAILNALEQALGLPRADVKLVLFPNRRSFEQGLVTSGYTPALARSASSFAAIGGARTVLVNAGVANRLDRNGRVQLVAHELVHSLQYHFGGGTRGASEQWLREGFAEWVSYRVTAHLALASFDSQRNGLLDPLGNLRLGHVPAPLDDLVTFPQWVEAQRRYELLYPQAFVATELLVERRGVPAIISYFERFRTSSDHERAFADAFGLDREGFERDFVRRWRETVAQFRARR